MYKTNKTRNAGKFMNIKGPWWARRGKEESERPNSRTWF